MRRFVSYGVGSLVIGLLAAAPASAQQSLNLYVGGFVPRSEDARDRNDVLVQNLNFLAFNIKDFNAATVGGEWLIGLGNNFREAITNAYAQTGKVRWRGLQLRKDIGRNLM